MWSDHTNCCHLWKWNGGRFYGVWPGGTNDVIYLRHDEEIINGYSFVRRMVFNLCDSISKSSVHTRSIREKWQMTHATTIFFGIKLEMLMQDTFSLHTDYTTTAARTIFLLRWRNCINVSPNATHKQFRNDTSVWIAKPDWLTVERDRRVALTMITKIE